jgi:hypothetical protein
MIKPPKGVTVIGLANLPEDLHNAIADAVGEPRIERAKTLIYQGRPLVAGDLKPGDEVEYDRDTGEVKSIKRSDQID